jgi:hypothetical protein
MSAQITFPSTPKTDTQRPTPRPRRRTAAVFAQYVQDLAQAQTQAPRPCSQLG